MAKYMIKGTYSSDGAKGLMDKGGSARADAIGKMISDMGGQMEAFYFGFGEDDVYVIVDSPNVETMIATAGAVKAAGSLARYETVVLVEPSQVDEAANVSVDYTPPGG